MSMTSHAGKKPKGLSIIDFLRPHWKALSLALLAVVGEAATDLLEPWPLKIVLDYLLQSKPPPSWLNSMIGWIGQDNLAVLNLPPPAAAANPRLALAEHDEKRTGDLIGRVTSDIEAIQAFITTALLGILASVFTLVGIIGVMFYLNWRFTLISLSIAPVL